MGLFPLPIESPPAHPVSDHAAASLTPASPPAHVLADDAEEPAWEVTFAEDMLKGRDALTSDEHAEERVEEEGVFDVQKDKEAWNGLDRHELAEQEPSIVEGERKDVALDAGDVPVKDGSRAPSP